MRFETSASFDADYRRLRPEHKVAFRAVIGAFSAACDDWLASPGSRWPAALRVAPIRGTKGIWEMTWSFASPDGRATFEFVTRDDVPACRWRRIGDHGVFKDP